MGDGGCPLCLLPEKEVDEDVEHFLLHCPILMGSRQKALDVLKHALTARDADEAIEMPEGLWSQFENLSSDDKIRVLLGAQADDVEFEVRPKKANLRFQFACLRFLTELAAERNAILHAECSGLNYSGAEGSLGLWHEVVASMETITS